MNKSDKETKLYYNSDKKLTSRQEEFLKRITELCAEYRIIINGNEEGVFFQELDEENIEKYSFYSGCDIRYHGDCIDDFNLTGFVGCNTEPNHQLDVVAIGNCKVPDHDCVNGV